MKATPPSPENRLLVEERMRKLRQLLQQTGLLEVAQSYIEGKSFEEIAKEFNISRSTIYRRLKSIGRAL